MESHLNGASAPPLYARAVRSFGTGTYEVIVGTTDIAGRSFRTDNVAVDLLKRMISADARGVALRSLSPAERRALRTDIEIGLGLPLRRDRKPGFVSLAATVAICDQRTLVAEVA